MRSRDCHQLELERIWRYPFSPEPGFWIHGRTPKSIRRLLAVVVVVDTVI